MSHIIYGKKCGLLVNIPIHGNLGDQAIAIAEHKVLNSIEKSYPLIECSGKVLEKYTDMIHRMYHNNTIFIHGGGYIGSLWEREEKIFEYMFIAFSGSKLVVFPQTMTFSDDEEGKKLQEKLIKLMDNHGNTTLCLREKVSYDMARNMFHNVNLLLVPDIVTYLRYDDIIEKREKVLLCLRNDKEKNISSVEKDEIDKVIKNCICDEIIQKVDTVLQRDLRAKNREKELIKKLREFASAKLIITDRLHGMVFSAIVGTPCIVLSNCNHKIYGVYEWIKENDYIIFINEISQLEEQINYLLDKKNCTYDNEEIRKQIRDGMIKAIS